MSGYVVLLPFPHANIKALITDNMPKEALVRAGPTTWDASWIQTLELDLSYAPTRSYRPPIPEHARLNSTGRRLKFVLVLDCCSFQVVGNTHRHHSAAEHVPDEVICLRLTPPKLRQQPQTLEYPPRDAPHLEPLCLLDPFSVGSAWRQTTHFDGGPFSTKVEITSREPRRQCVCFETADYRLGLRAVG